MGKTISFDEKYLIRTTQELCRIRAVNEPPHITDYTTIANYLAKELESFGFKVVIAGKIDYPNVIGRLKLGNETNKCIMFNAHMDTVPPGDRDRWNFDPFGGEYKQGYVYGRGACDMRGQIAMLLTVAKALQDNSADFNGELAVSFVSGHETGSINGSVYLSQTKPELLQADLCLIPEPSNFNLSVASRGIYWLKAKTFGLNGHSACFNEVRSDGTVIPPVNAIHKMNKFISRLLDVDTWMTYKKNQYTGPENGMYSDKPIVEVNLISAGEKQNTVPGECSATIDIRFLPGQNPEQIMNEIQALVVDIRKEDPEFLIEFATDMIQSPPIDVSLDSPLYELVKRNMKDILGLELKPCGVCAPGDAVAFGKLMPVAWLGPTWDNAHGFNERVSIAELLDLSGVYYSIALDYLR